MPTYSYVCTACGHAFDIHQSFSDESLTTCPECQGALRKKFSSVGVVFKGSGFYRTDSRSGSPSVGAGKTSSGGSASGGSGSGSSTSGPAGSTSGSSGTSSSTAGSGSTTSA